MKKWNLLDRVTSPDGKTLTLHEHDGAFTIRVEGLELMSTRKHESEDKLAELGCAHLQDKPSAKILIGGLGLGFTLKTALRCLPRKSTVQVAEISEAVIRWNRNPDYKLAGPAMNDPRTQILNRDVFDVMAEAPQSFDGILLDVDNGPAALSADSNRRLYQPVGLLMAKAALKPQGRLAFWSASEDDVFVRLMQKNGFSVEVIRARQHSSSGGWHAVFLGSLR